MAILAIASDCENACCHVQRMIVNLTKTLESSKLLCEVNGVFIVDKIKTITSKVYGIKDKSILNSVFQEINMLEADGYGHLWIEKSRNPSRMTQS